MRKRYLGDGVYVAFDEDGGQIVLTAEDGQRASDTIYLDLSLFMHLQNFVNEHYLPKEP